MESNSFLSFVQQGFRTAIGATTSAIETLQDPIKREQTLSELNEEWKKKSQEWQLKGEITEQEARRMIEAFFAKQSSNSQTSSNYSEPVNSTNDSQSYSPRSTIETQIQELNEAVISLRVELQKMNASND